jgi:hypothetical protein
MAKYDKKLLMKKCMAAAVGIKSVEKVFSAAPILRRKKSEITFY